MSKRMIMLVLALATGAAANAQIAPSLHGYTSSLTVGGEFSGFQTDASSHPIEYGVGAYADYNFLPFLGVEVEGRTIQFHQQNNIRQDIISGGFRYIYNHNRFAPYAKALAGLGSADFPAGSYAGLDRRHDTFSTVSLGGGLDYKLTPKIYLRGDYEYQFWLDYGRGPLPGLGTLNPTGISVGVSYRIF